MKALLKIGCASSVLLLVAASGPAYAQFGGFGGEGQDQMQQYAPMIEMMKKRLGKRRFTQLMQTMGPMLANMQQQGGGMGGMGMGDMFGSGQGTFGSGQAMQSMMGMMASPQMIDLIEGMIDGSHGRHSGKKHHHVARD